MTFEISKNGKSLDIFFDEEGRNRLTELISLCQKPGDHQHMWILPGNVLEMTPGRFLTGSEPLTEVTLGMPGPSMSLICDDSGMDNRR